MDAGVAIVSGPFYALVSLSEVVDIAVVTVFLANWSKASGGADACLYAWIYRSALYITLEIAFAVVWLRCNLAT